MPFRRLTLALLPLLAAVLFSLTGTQAQARNVPGSASAMGISIGEVVTGEHQNFINDFLASIARSAGVSSDRIKIVSVAPGFLADDGDPAAMGVEGVFTNGDLSFAANIGYRNIDTDTLDYDLMTGAALVGGAVGSDTLLFGGLLLEHGKGDTLANDGTMDHDGIGLTLGLSRSVGEATSLSATFGHIWASYDFTRSGGAISGSFDATRSFLDLSAAHRIVSGKATTDLNGGLRYVTQTNDAYTELGGAAVDKTTGESFAVVFGARTTFDLENGMNTFVEMDLSQNISASDNLPVGLREAYSSDTRGRLGVGFATGKNGFNFETGVGSNFDEDGYSGIDAHLSLNLQF